MNELLCLLKQSTKEEFMALRDGKISLSQLCRDQTFKSTGVTFTVMDDIIDRNQQLP
jgi:hypothetical protein